MVETLYGRHHNEQQAEQGYGKALDQQNVFLYAVGVGLLEEGRQITCFAHCEDTFGRTCHPGQHACQHTECQSHGDDRRQPRSMDILEVIIKAYQQTLCQVDVLFGNDDPQCEGAEHEDDHGDSRTDEYGFRIVLGRIFHVFYVDTAHFHTGIEQEDAGSQYQVVEVAEVGEEVAEEFKQVFLPEEIPLIMDDKGNGKYQLDLWKANELILTQAGIRKENLDITDICTCCNSDKLFSHRASHGKRGNLGCFMCL